MQYFDRTLLEVLNNSATKTRLNRKRGLSGQKLYNEMKRLANRAGEPDLDYEERERRWNAYEALRTGDNDEEFKKCWDKIAEDNKNNKAFIGALENRARGDNNLMVWMLRHLASKV